MTAPVREESKVLPRVFLFLPRVLNGRIVILPSDFVAHPRAASPLLPIFPASWHAHFREASLDGMSTPDRFFNLTGGGSPRHLHNAWTQACLHFAWWTSMSGSENFRSAFARTLGPLLCFAVVFLSKHSKRHALKEETRTFWRLHTLRAMGPDLHGVDPTPSPHKPLLHVQLHGCLPRFALGLPLEVVPGKWCIGKGKHGGILRGRDAGEWAFHVSPFRHRLAPDPSQPHPIWVWGSWMRAFLTGLAWPTWI